MHALTCPQCGQELRVPASVLGGPVKCPLCGYAFKTPPPPAPAADAATPAESGPQTSPAATPPTAPAASPAPAAPVTTAAAPTAEAAPADRAPAAPPPEEEEPPWAEPVAEPSRTRPVRDFVPVRFTVLVWSDPHGQLQGRLPAELTPEGLRLRQGEQPDVVAPVGTPAAYLGRKRFRVQLPGRQVEFEVTAPDGRQARLARDAADFLSGRKEVPEDARLPAPWYLHLPALLPLGIPAIAIPLGVLVGGVLGGVLWGAVGAGLAGCCLAVVRARWSAAARVLASLALAGGGYLVLLAGVLVGWALTPPAIDPSAWQTFSLPGGGFRVLMPGTPGYREAWAPPGLGPNAPTYFVGHRRPDIEFMLGYSDVPLRAWGPSPGQRLDHGRHALLGLSQNTQLVREANISLGTYPGREWVLRFPDKNVKVARMYIVGRRTYLLAADGHRLDPDSRDVRTFLESFQIDPAPVEQPPPVAQQGPPPLRPPPGPVAENLEGGGKAFTGHPGKVVAVTFSRAENLMAVASGDGSVTLWEPDAGQVRATYPGQPNDRLTGMALSPDGQTLATAGVTGTLRLMGVHKGGVRTLQGGTAAVWCVAFSPDSRTLASGHRTGEIKLWDVATETRKTSFLGGNGPVLSLAFFPGGRALVSGGERRAVELWDLEARARVAVLKGHGPAPAPGTGFNGPEWALRSLAVSPDGKTLATASNDRTARLWDVKAWKERASLSYPETVTAVAFSPNGRLLATGCANGIAKLLDPAAGADRGVVMARDAGLLTVAVTAVAFHPDGARLAVARGQTVELCDIGRVFTPRPGELGPAPPPPATYDDPVLPRGLTRFRAFPEQRDLADRVGALALSPDGRTLAIGCGRTFKTWSVPDRRQKMARLHPKGADAAAYSPDGRTLAASNGDIIYLYDADAALTRPPVLSGKGASAGKVTWLAFSPDGQTLAAARASAAEERAAGVDLWDVEARKVRVTLLGHTGGTNGVAWSADGRLLATAGQADPVVRLWDAATGREQAPLRGHEGGVCCVAWSADGKRIASGGVDGTARLWDPGAGTEVRALKAGGPVDRVAFLADNKSLASATSGGVLQLWDPTAGKVLASAHLPGGVGALAPDRDGKDLFLGCAGGLVGRLDLPAISGRPKRPDPVPPAGAPQPHRP